MINKVPIELTPYNALVIVKFLREWVNDDNNNDPIFRAIHEAVRQFEDQVFNNMNHEQLEDGKAENQVNQLIGKSPIRK